MHRMRWLIYAWPGLPQLLAQGTWTSLATALALTALVNLALIGTFGWSELFSPGMRNAVWIALGVAWMATLFYSWGAERSGVGGQQPDRADDNFAEALHDYLRGNWFEAERRLIQRLTEHPRDLDARLMLATLMRHTQRWDEAEEQLACLERISGSQKWLVEVVRERQLLAAGRAGSDAVEPQPEALAADTAVSGTAA